MNGKNILLVTCVFPPEPVVSANISYDLAIELSKKNNVKVLSPNPSRPKNYKFNNIVLSENFEHIKLNSFIYPDSRLLGRTIESFSFGLSVRNYINKYRNLIDVVYINSWPIFSQFIISQTCKKYNIPYIIHIQDIYPETIFYKKSIFNLVPNLVLKFIDRIVLKNSFKVITISPQMLNYISTSRK